MQGIYDVIIIGSGPAGLTAAVYTTRGAASTLVIGGEAWGGQLMLTTKVENFPGFPDGIQGSDLMMNMRKQAERLGAKFLERNVDAVRLNVTPFELVTSDGVVHHSKSLIIATGALTKWLDVPGERELIGRGVSTCAPCDAPFFKGKKVAVVGGGDTAMEEADMLTKYASEVIMIHRREAFRASEAMQKKVLENPKIKVFWNTEVIEIIGQVKVERLKLKDNKTGKTREENFDGVFIAIGHQPDSDTFKGKLDMDEKGFIKVVGGHSKTSVHGVFVAGDVMDSYYKQAVTAAGSGCAAALDTLKFLGQNYSL